MMELLSKEGHAEVCLGNTMSLRCCLRGIILRKGRDQIRGAGPDFALRPQVGDIYGSQGEKWSWGS